MKKILAYTLIAIILTISVSAAHVYPDFDPNDPDLSYWESGLGYQPTADIAKVIYIDYGFPKQDQKDMICQMFGVDAKNIKSFSEPLTIENVTLYIPGAIEFFGPSHITPPAQTVEEAYERLLNETSYGETGELVMYYYDFSDDETYSDSESIRENADIILYTLTSTGKYYFGGFSHLYANKIALTHMEQELSGILETISTPQKLFEVCGKDVPTEYFDVDKYHKEPLTSDSFEVLGCNARSRSGLSLVTGKYLMCGSAETPANDHVYLTSPWSANFLRKHWLGFEMASIDPIYNYSGKAGSGRLEMIVNYAAEDGIDEADYLNYTVDNIELAMYTYSLPIYSSAPATSLTTAIYAAVAALALGVVVVKKKH